MIWRLEETRNLGVGYTVGDFLPQPSSDNNNNKNNNDEWWWW